MTDLKFKEVTKCRVCGSAALEVVIDFGHVSYSTSNNQLHKENSKFEDFAAPLTFLKCPNCLNFQLGEVVSPALLYENFSYKSDTTLGLEDYFSELAVRIQKRFNTKNSEKKFILEIGSNNGRFISLFKSQNWHTVGVEPSSSLAEETIRMGVKTYTSFFSKDLAEQIKRNDGTPDVIYIANTLANIHDLNEIFEAFSTMMNMETTLIIDTQDVNKVIDKHLIDTIYHEHLNYFSVSSIQYLCEKFSLSINQVDYHPSKGGCFTVHISRSDKSNKKDFVGEILKSEEQDLSRGKIDKFTTSIFQTKEMITKSLKGNIKNSCCFGSSVGCSMLVNFLNLDEHCEFIYDDNPNCETVLGVRRNLKVFPSDKLFQNSNVKNIIILAHRYAENILSKWPDSFKDKVKLVYPVPKS